MTDSTSPFQDRAALSITEVCESAGISRATVYDLINSGQLPARKLGTRTLIMKRDFERLLDSLPKLEAK